MTTPTTTIADFLLARIAEDEAIPFRIVPDTRTPEGFGGRGFGHECLICGDGPSFGGTFAAIVDIAAEHAERIHRRSRVLAECEAKRRIVELHRSWPMLVETPPTFEAVDSDDVSAVTLRMSKQIAWTTEQQYREHFGTEPPAAPMLRALAAVYADHPDYREEWRP